jgi:hypothetical protein
MSERPDRRVGDSPRSVVVAAPCKLAKIPRLVCDLGGETVSPGQRSTQRAVVGSQNLV